MEATGSLSVDITQLCVPSDLCVHAYKLAVCKFHPDNMCSKEVPAPQDSNVKDMFVPHTRQVSRKPWSPHLSPFVSSGQEAGHMGLSTRDWSRGGELGGVLILIGDVW